MDKNIRLEQVIKSTLQRKAEEVQAPVDLWDKINAGLTNTSIIKNRTLSVWRIAAVVASVTIVSGIILVAFSQEARVMAAQLVYSLKKIFVVEKVGDSYQAVEKPVEEFKISLGLCEIVHGLNNYELGKKVGFQINFPSFLEDYLIDFRVIGVKLDKRLDVDTFRQLEDRIKKAMYDDSALEELKIYDAYRYTGAFYRKGEATIGVYISRPYQIKNCVLYKVTIQNCDEGFWLEHPRHQFFDDERNKDKNMQVRHSLFWNKNGLGFYLRPEGEVDITFDEAIRIAELFSKGY